VATRFYAQPLIVDKVTRQNRTHNIVIVATVNDSFTPSLRTMPWPAPQRARQFLGPNAWVVAPRNFGHDRGLRGAIIRISSGQQLGSVAPQVHFDPVSRTLYLVARTKERRRTARRSVSDSTAWRGHRRSGADQQPGDITANYPGTGAAGTSAASSLLTRQKQNRGGLAWVKRGGYVSWASHAIAGPYPAG